MPVEIRELIIKTEIYISDRNHQGGMREEEMQVVKKLLLEECKKMIAEKIKKTSYKR